MTLENLKQYQDGVMLAEDEANHVHRIRASREVHAWLRAMSAEQRGQVLTQVYAAQAGRPAATPAPPPIPAPTPKKQPLPVRPGAARDEMLAAIVAELKPGRETMRGSDFNRLVHETARARYGENRIPRALNQKIAALRRR